MLAACGFLFIHIVHFNRVGLSNHINGNPFVEVLEKIANALDVDIAELFAPSSYGGIVGSYRIPEGFEFSFFYLCSKNI
ncbi:MAG TPA: hypothetical protein K8W04_05390 [Bacteroides reticulotermitis]|nr:hypothetical protein [Bacteroides reticulotermitis]